MATSVKLVLGDHPAADHTAHIYVRIIHNRKKAYIQTKAAVTFSDWKAADQIVKNSCKIYYDIPALNEHLWNLKAQVNTFVNNLIDINTLTASQIKIRFLAKDTEYFFCEYAEKIMDELRTANRIGNLTVYQMAVSFLKKHIAEPDIIFAKMDTALLYHLESAHLAAGNTRNSLSVYMRTLKAIYNRAIKDKLAKPEWYPFAGYRIKTTKTAKRAIRKKDIEKIERYCPAAGSPLCHARNYFLFSFYLIGINFTDMAFLKISNLKGNRIEYYRAKTGRFYSLRVNDKAMAILIPYLEGKTGDDFIFPVIRRPEDATLRRKDIMNALKTFNKYLKLMATELGIDAKLTSYVSRHSWASIGKQMNVPIAVISEALGHENIKTTQIYLDSLDKDVIDTASRLITG